MTPTQSCQEILQELLGPYLSTPTLEGILSQLGLLGAQPLCQLDAPTAGALRRRLERIGRSYLNPRSSADTLRRFDGLLNAAGIELPAYDPNVSGTFSIPTQSTPKTPLRSDKSTPPTPPLAFPFQAEGDLDATMLQVQKALLDYLMDENVARRLEMGIRQAARGNLRVGGGEIRLELDAGLRGRMVFKVIGKDGQIRLSGAAFASR